MTKGSTSTVDGLTYQLYTISSITTLSSITLSGWTGDRIVEISSNNTNWYTVSDVYVGDSANPTINFVADSHLKLTANSYFPLVGGYSYTLINPNSSAVTYSVHTDNLSVYTASTSLSANSTTTINLSTATINDVYYVNVSNTFGLQIS